jgi:hypothetical protein
LRNFFSAIETAVSVVWLKVQHIYKEPNLSRPKTFSVSVLVILSLYIRDKSHDRNQML